MSWNYRVRRHHHDPAKSGGQTESFSVVEVYYDPAGKIVNWSSDITPYGDTVEDLKADLGLMLRAFDQPTLDLKDPSA